MVSAAELGVPPRLHNFHRWRVQIQCYLVGMIQNIGKLLQYYMRPGTANSVRMDMLSNVLLHTTCRH